MSVSAIAALSSPYTWVRKLVAFSGARDSGATRVAAAAPAWVLTATFIGPSIAVGVRREGRDSRRIGLQAAAECAGRRIARRPTGHESLPWPQAKETPMSLRTLQQSLRKPAIDAGRHPQVERHRGHSKERKTKRLHAESLPKDHCTRYMR